MVLTFSLIFGCLVLLTYELVSTKGIIKLNRNIEYLVVLFFFVAGNVIFMHHFGVLDSGYHLIDDHEIYSFRSHIEDYGFWGNLKFLLSEDLVMRFRPAYIFFRTLFICLVKDNFFIWHLVFSVLSGVNFSLLYVASREFGCGICVSYIFSIITFIGGGQSALLYRLGPQEAIALVLLLMWLVILLWYKKRNSKLCIFLLLFLEILIAGFKESFLALIPIFPILGTYLLAADKNLPFSFKGYLNVLKEQKVLLGGSVLIFSLGAAFTVFYTGVGGIDYAGLATEYGLSEWMMAFQKIATGRLLPYLLFAAFAIVSVVLYLLIYHKSKGTWAEYGICFVIFFYSIATQFIIYAKSEMYERYLIPSVLIILLWGMPAAFHFFDNSRVKVIYSFICIAFGIFMMFRVDDQNRIITYAEDGKNTNALFAEIGELESKYGEDMHVILDVGYEANYSIITFLSSNYQMNNIHLRTEDECEQMQDSDLVITSSVNESDIFTTLLEESNYEKHSFGDYNLFINSALRSVE